MANTLSDVLAPHYCCSCGEIGEILCAYCKYDITSDPFSQCVVCAHPVNPKSHLCTECKTAYSRAWCVGWRNEALRSLIDTFKFERVRAAHVALAELLDEVLPILPETTIIVPIPTIARHRRIYGYGHTELVAGAFARLRGLPYAEALQRRHRHVQRGATRQERVVQAKASYIPSQVQKGATYLLLDDVYTTGSTLEYASRALLKGGAGQVWIAVISRQPLEK